MKKTLTVRRALLIFTPILLVACFLTSQLCYRFMYIPARSKYQQMAAEITEQMTEKDALLNELKRVKGLFDGKYVGSLSEKELLDAVINAYVDATGDKYAEYYTAEEYAALLQSYEGQGVGIGVRISTDASGRLMVVYAEKEAPAYKAGVRAGDEIVAVEGKRVSEIGSDAASTMLIGKKGTEAVFTVKNGQGEREISVTREEVSYSTVLYSLEEGKIGYLRILSFSSTTYKEFKAAVDDLEKQGAAALVFDLRQNGGGLLSSVHDVLDYLISDGTKEEPLVVVTTKDKNENEQRYICDDGHSVALPMAVL
ncbi:MAG: PDZ domain-containing protein, partial [Clostridia bacterium]|nr:PDZ domain-containing protein [Clostridia bacterium]